jgi:hypothetical protein
MYVRGMVQTCPQCQTQARSWVDWCPDCGVRLSSPSRIRALGWVLIVIGTGLVAGMAYLLVVIADIIRGSSDPGATSRFAGTPRDALMIYAILGLVLAFGAVSVVSGAWHVRYGTRNPRLVKVVLGFAAVFFGIGALVGYLS